jgi:VIT family
LNEPEISKHLLSPADRVAEILFGLIMALSFTCTISVIESDRTLVKDMLIGAIGCNIAWGLVDAIMYLLLLKTEKGRGITIFNFVRKNENIDRVHQFIADELPPVIASGMQRKELEAIRQKLIQMPEPPVSKKLKFTDYRTAFGIFILVFLSTFPVAVPFLLIDDVKTALRVSNITAIILMFICGWILAKYAGANRFIMGIIMSLVGSALVLITISLGG